MSEFPYTLGQVEDFRVALRPYRDLGTLGVSNLLLDLRDAGITLTFPEPRYYATAGPGSRHHIVYDRGDGVGSPFPVAEFYGYPDACQHSLDHAKRLNESQP